MSFGAYGSASNSLGDLEAGASHFGPQIPQGQTTGGQSAKPKRQAQARLPLFLGKAPFLPSLFLLFSPSTVSFSFRRSRRCSPSGNACVRAHCDVCLFSHIYEKFPRSWMLMALLTGTDPTEPSLYFILVQTYTFPKLRFSVPRLLAQVLGSRPRPSPSLLPASTSPVHPCTYTWQCYSFPALRFLHGSLKIKSEPLAWHLWLCQLLPSVYTWH